MTQCAETEQHCLRRYRKIGGAEIVFLGGLGASAYTSGAGHDHSLRKMPGEVQDP